MDNHKTFEELQTEIAELEQAPLYPGKYKDVALKQAQLRAYRDGNRRKRYGKITTHQGEKLQLKMRQIKALELRQAGLTWTAIAAELGYAGESSARKAVYAALRDAAGEPTEHVIMLEDMRLDRLFLANWPDAINPNANPEIRRKAAEVCLKIMDRRSKLHGLDRPTAQTTEEQTQGQEVTAAKNRLMDRLTIMFEREREPRANQDNRDAVEVIDGSFRGVEPLSLDEPHDDIDDYDEEIDEEDSEDSFDPSFEGDPEDQPE